VQNAIDGVFEMRAQIEESITYRPPGRRTDDATDPHPRLDPWPAAESGPEAEAASDFERLREAISTARTQDDIDDLWEESRQCVISHSEREALGRTASERAAALQSAA